MKKRVVALIASFLLAGCALSPQEVEVTPKVVVKSPIQVSGSPISVAVYDERISNSLGSRGGVYGNTNAISTTQNLPLALRSSIESGLKELGMSVTDSREAAQFHVYFDELDYKVPEGSYITQVDLKARVKVVVKNELTRFEGRYSSSMTERVLSAPSDEKNIKLINKVVSDVLSRAFDDVRLQQFLAQL